jgi:plasmid stability protein
VKITKESIEAFSVEFESEEELQREFETNLSAGGLLLSSTEKPTEMSTIQLNLKLTEGGSFTTGATVVRLFDGAFAVSVEANPREILSSLTARPEAPAQEDATDDGEELTSEKRASVWDRVRALPYAEKIILATKTDRSERAVLIQENDPQILYYLLKNPRITTEEVLRIARMTSISAMAADLIAKTTQWSTNQEIRSALVNNPRTAPSLALKLLATLSEREIRHIAKSTAVSQPLKQAAVKILLNRVG